MKHLKKSSIKGFSLLELLLAIAIIGLIILMATRYFTTVKAGQQASAAIQEVQGIRSAIGTQLAQGTAPGSVTIASTCPTLPASFCNSGLSKLVMPWDTTDGGSSAIAASATSTTITVSGIPTLAACQNILNAFTKDLTGTLPTCSASAYGSLALEFAN